MSPVQQKRGRECVWGLTQKEYIRELSGRDGKWLYDRWLALKEDFKRNGLNQYHCWVEAAALCPPPNWTAEEVLEILRRADREDESGKLTRAKDWAWEVKTNPPPEDASVRGDHFWVLRQTDLNPAGKTYVPRPSEGVGPVDGLGKLTIKAVLEKAKGRSATEREEVRWVVSNLLVDWADIDVDRVPSAAAVSILSWAKSNTDSFMRDHYRAMLPSRAEVDADARRQDSGRELSDREQSFLESLRKQAEKAVA